MIDKIDKAIKRVEQSRDTHVEWAMHLLVCDHCKKDPPKHVHAVEEQREIVEEYNLVLDVLYEYKRKELND